MATTIDLWQTLGAPGDSSGGLTYTVQPPTSYNPGTALATTGPSAMGSGTTPYSGWGGSTGAPSQSSSFGQGNLSYNPALAAQPTTQPNTTWNTSKDQAPINTGMFGGTLYGQSGATGYSTQPVSPTGQPVTQQPVRQPPPARPDSQTMPPVTTQPVGPGGQPVTYPPRSVPGATPTTQNPLLWNPSYGGGWGVPTPSQYTPPIQYGQPGAYMPMPNTGAQNPTGYANTTDWWGNQNVMDSWLPYATYEQNRQQYANDYNESMRRWNEQFGWTQQADAFNMNLAQRQQMTAEEAQRVAAQQWASQFGHTQQMDQAGLALQQQAQNWTQQYQGGQLDLQRSAQQIEAAYNQGRLTNEQRQIALSELTQRQNNAYQYAQLAQQGGLQGRELDIQQQAQNWQQQYQGGQLDLQRRAQDIEQQYNMGRLTNEQRQVALAELTQAQTFGLQQQAQNWNQQYQGSQLQIQQQQANIEELYRRGQISNEQRSIALQELAQQQNYGLQQQQFGLAQQGQQFEQQYQMQQMAQQAALAREQYALQRELATMQNYGRAQRPNVRTLQTWR